MLTASFRPLRSAASRISLPTKSVYGNTPTVLSDDDGVRSLQPGIDHGGAAGGADLNVAADQSARHRLAAGELDDFQVLDAVLLEIMSFLGGPKRRLSGAEDSAGAQRLLGKERGGRRKLTAQNAESAKG